jgi:hypothetical protein
MSEEDASMSTHPTTTARPPQLPHHLPQTGDHDGETAVDHPGMAPLRSYLILLTPRRRSPKSQPRLHYVLEESPDRAVQVCAQSYPEHRILSIRDVTDEATAA